MRPLDKTLTWQQRQALIEKALAEQFAEAVLSGSTYVAVNPYGTSPLSALVYHKFEGATVTVMVAGQNGSPDFVYSVKATENGIPVYGLYAGVVNTVTVTSDKGLSLTENITPDALPDELAPLSAAGSLPDNRWLFAVPVAGKGFPAAYDAAGNCRWYSGEKGAFRIMQTQNGHLWIGGPALLCPPYSATGIREIDLTGKILKEYRIPGGVCNGFCELPDGNILALHQFFPRGTAGDMCVVIDRATGEVIKEWDFRKYLPMTKGGSTSQIGADWFHGSSVAYDRETDSVTVTGTYQDIILNFDFSTGDINWILGDPSGWPEDLVQKYFLSPDDSNMEWFYEPTDAQLAGDTLVCFDCGHQRTKKGGTPLPVEQRFSRVVAYRISGSHVAELGSYGKSEGTNLYSPYLSNCGVYGEDCLMNFGGIGILDGAPAEPPAYFQLKHHPETEMYSDIYLKNITDTRFHLKLPFNTYHASIAAPAAFSFGSPAVPGVVLGGWHGNDSFGIELEWEDGGMLPEEYRMTASYTEEQLFVNATYKNGDVVMILLDGENGTESFYVQVTRAPYLTAGLQTFAPDFERPVSYFVDLTGLKGIYELCIGITDKKYHTGFSITCGQEEAL